MKVTKKVNFVFCVSSTVYIFSKKPKKFQCVIQAIAPLNTINDYKGQTINLPASWPGFSLKATTEAVSSDENFLVFWRCFDFTLSATARSGLLESKTIAKIFAWFSMFPPAKCFKISLPVFLLQP